VINTNRYNIKVSMEVMGKAINMEREPTRKTNEMIMEQY
jgi:hypothetical protein